MSVHSMLRTSAIQCAQQARATSRSWEFRLLLLAPSSTRRVRVFIDTVTESFESLSLRTMECGFKMRIRILISWPAAPETLFQFLSLPLLPRCYAHSQLTRRRIPTVLIVESIAIVVIRLIY